jgi:ATP-dependent Zn protease
LTNIKAAFVASDFLPLFFVRHVAQFAKLARPYRSSLRATRVRRSEVSEATAREIDLAVRKIVEHAFAQATEILTARRKDLEAGAALLLQKEVITGDDFPPLLRAKDKALPI